ncbi:MAG: AIR carboxylase family protein, partial [Pseudomonadota bacterium]|nr:AIR carboxylase family protein [Pseudomonadota bacterium]
LGVPVQSRALSGNDSLLSIVQMPGGIPVGTLAIGDAGSKNAGILASQIVGNSDVTVRAAVTAFRTQQTQMVLDNPDPRAE